MKKFLLLLFLFLNLSINVYADDIPPSAIINNEYNIGYNNVTENNNILENYKNKTFLIFSAVLLLLIVIAAISVRKSLKENNNDNANS